MIITNDNIDQVIETLKKEIKNLRARCVVSDEDLEHLRAIRAMPGMSMEPHISALNKKFQFDRWDT